MAAAQRTLDFWTALDGDKLADVGRKEREGDLVGPAKGQKPAQCA